MRIWCAQRNKRVFVEKTCLKCLKAYKCTRFSTITIVSFDYITKDKKLKKKLQKLLELFKFINDSSGHCGKIPIEEVGW